jgi:hypothetical protein
MNQFSKIKNKFLKNLKHFEKIHGQILNGMKIFVKKEHFFKKHEHFFEIINKF